MKIVYKSWDNREFDSDKECLRYEKENPCWKGWVEGVETDNPLDADTVVILGKEGEQSFKDSCELWGVDTFGIEGEGLYFWNNGEWRELYESVQNSVAKAFDYIDLHNCN